MFIRKVLTRNKETGKTYVAYRLVASRLTDKGPRQHTVMNLGQLDLPKEKWPRLAKLLELKLAGQPLLELGGERDPALEVVAEQAFEHHGFVLSKQKEQTRRHGQAEYVRVDVNSIQASKARSLGPELVAQAFWQRLDFEKHLESCGLDRRERALARAVILGRLVHPGSELETWRWLTQASVLPELIGLDPEDIGKNPIYKIADRLWEHKQQLERRLYASQGSLFGRAATVFLYDLTNTYFEGLCRRNPLALHGKSKEKRSDCRLVSLALVVDEAGMPVMSRIYGGNQSEPETLEEILDQIYNPDALLGGVRPTIVMDRGLATRENLDLLRQRGLPYTIIERCDLSRQYADEFKNATAVFDEARDSAEQVVRLKKVIVGEGARVLCLSEARREKEDAMDRLHEQRLIKEVEKVRASLKRGKPKKADAIQRRLGRLDQKYPTVARHFQLEPLLDEQGAVRDILCRQRAEADAKKATHGCYVIETTHREMSAEQIWRLYMTLTRVEDGFRALKSDLGLRPVFHQTEARTQAHLFIAVLAYHLLAAIEFAAQQKGDTRRWSSLREILATHQRLTVALDDDQNQVRQLRISTVPEAVHREIYERMEITDPLPRRTAIAGKRG